MLRVGPPVNDMRRVFSTPLLLTVEGFTMATCSVTLFLQYNPRVCYSSDERSFFSYFQLHIVPIY